MQLGYVIIYVADVSETMAFYERAFGLERKFLHDSGLYGEMDTGQTTLAFAGEAMMEMNGVSVRPNRRTDVAAGVEIALVSDDPKAAYAKAVATGAEAMKEPAAKPWGQIVGYVRDINGCLVELCSPVAG